LALTARPGRLINYTPVTPRGHQLHVFCRLSSRYRAQPQQSGDILRIFEKRRAPTIIARPAHKRRTNGKTGSPFVGARSWHAQSHPSLLGLQKRDCTDPLSGIPDPMITRAIISSSGSLGLPREFIANDRSPTNSDGGANTASMISVFQPLTKQIPKAERGHTDCATVHPFQFVQPMHELPHASGNLFVNPLPWLQPGGIRDRLAS